MTWHEMQRSRDLQHRYVTVRGALRHSLQGGAINSSRCADISCFEVSRRGVLDGSPAGWGHRVRKKQRHRTDLTPKKKKKKTAYNGLSRVVLARRTHFESGHRVARLSIFRPVFGFASPSLGVHVGRQLGRRWATHADAAASSLLFGRARRRQCLRQPLHRVQENLDKRTMLKKGTVTRALR